MKRVNSLVATIMGTVVHSVQVLINLYSLILVFSLIPSAGDSSAGVVAYVVLTTLLLMAIFIVALALTLATFKYVNGSPELYAKKRATTIATIVFDLLVVILLLAFGISSSIPSTVINVLSALIILASAVLYIVDLCLEKKRVEKVNKDAVAEPTEVKEEKPVVEEKTEEKK